MYVVRGQCWDGATRCRHYHSTLDIVGLSFKCCPGFYWPCYECHTTVMPHDPVRYDTREESEVKCVLCGECKTQLTFSEYTATGSCPACNASFNPQCRAHYPLYFEMH
ncbi:Hot13p KNAG_0H00320 [Huiozyma naganishii CBS 8797]|uniref:Uncharacterized protein n=1 Tax=Huiozyma naganishii (strain ATCC MYA-139 / BCRC 22969 / CBS 8797 / KCTC 17520 / NBRC 10181 / NCYC 3082 / Yp74L-3) TaxID=1071383 RepID=J7RP61_HUIN7|nr:hypothetical protein KNAG_0H00320 [Kazachstania naganishii CBS 8797]CCK71448.1 hypothetical protein KNAG_0H00320 [Kazachstania naganishii CBS 8797]